VLGWLYTYAFFFLRVSRCRRVLRVGGLLGCRPLLRRRGPEAVLQYQMGRSWEDWADGGDRGGSWPGRREGARV